ncbi:MAG: hypothetical protein HYX61_13410 [Gammaproteobacteria bacterium]|jgi:curved DNA-binding protein CbpA|nr:hypothetical protein [Gammaproteobacteria bacterium]
MNKNRDRALEMLGLVKGSTPTDEAIIKAFKRKSLIYHPDKTKFPAGATEEVRQKLLAKQNKKFLSISSAKMALLNPEKFSGFQHSNHSAEFFKAWLERVLNDAKMEFQKPYGMYVKTAYSNDGGSRNGFWGITDVKELVYKCNEFHRIPSGHKHPINEIKISNGPVPCPTIKLPVNASQLILQAMKKNKHLIKVNVPKYFFNRDQKKRLITHLLKNRQSAKLADALANKLATQKGNKIYQRKKAQQAGWIVLGAFVGFSIACIIGFSFSLTIGWGVGGSIIGSALCFGYQAYAAWASLQYNNAYKINSIADEKEHDALKSGIEAQFWPGYFKSYFRTAGYFYPIAFAAAKEHAMNGNTEIIGRIKSFSLKV